MPQTNCNKHLTSIFGHSNILWLFLDPAQISSQIESTNCHALQAHYGTLSERRGSVGGKYRLTGIAGDARVVDEFIA